MTASALAQIAPRATWTPERRAVLRFLREQAQFLRHVRMILRLQRQIKKIKNPANEMMERLKITPLFRHCEPQAKQSSLQKDKFWIASSAMPPRNDNFEKLNSSQTLANHDVNHIYMCLIELIKNDIC